MRSERNILIAFILNLAFSIFEFVGGVITGSVAIASDAIHDLGDAASIGVAYFLERKSKKQPDEKYTYGYARYSVIGSLITTLILLTGSCVMIYNAVLTIIHPKEIDYSGMIIFAVVGVCTNLCAAFFTSQKGSLNQKAVNLHMLEDVLGWLVVLIGAVVMRFTDFALLDPIMSIGVSVFILVNAIRNIKEVFGVFLEKASVDITDLKEHICEIDGVLDIHHIHVWSMDGENNYATMHIVTDRDTHEVKERIREELREHGIGHVTIETETAGEHCREIECHVEINTDPHGHLHHHHHHGH